MLEALLQFRHRRFRRDLSAYVDGMLSERARRRLEAHLDSCQACRQELAELRATVEALGSLPMAEVPRSFTLAAAPVAEVRPRPAARRLEFGLRLATATAAFALALVVIGDFAGLPGGGEEEEEWVRGQLYSATQETPAAMEVAPVETPAVEETPAAMEAAPVGTPAVEETPAAMEAAPAETIERVFSDIAVTPGPPAVGADVSGEEPAEKEAMEGAEVEEEAEGYGAEAQAVAEEEGGGLSREEAVRWLEVGLGAGVGILVLIWAFARFQRRIGNRA
jgi:anti-sigma factor RsiW